MRVKEITKADLFLVIVAAGIGILFIYGIIITNLRGIVHFCDVDMYADLSVAKLMWEQKTLFPENWIFGNQYYIIATPVWCALFYGITGNLSLSMGIASSVMGCLTVLAFVWMLIPFVAQKRHLIIAAVALLGCVVSDSAFYNTFSQLFFTMCSYYSCYMITAFLVWGEYARIQMGKNQMTGKGPYLICALCVALSFCTGLQSFRQTFIMLVPICIVEMFFLVKSVYHRINPLSRKAFWFTAANVVANVLGLLVIRLLAIPRYTIYGDYGLIGSFAEAKNNLMEIIESLITAVGFGNQDNIWIFGYSICLLVIFLVSFLIMIIKKEKTGFSLLVLLNLISILVVMGGKLVTHMQIRPAYLCFWYPLVCLCFVYLLESCSLKFLRTLLLLSFCMAMFINYRITYSSVYDWIAVLQEDYNERVEVCNWMRENGYNRLFGRNNFTEQVAVVSNGDILSACWGEDSAENMFLITPCLVNTDIYQAEHDDETLYLIMDDAEEIFLEKAKSMGAEVEMVRDLEHRNAKLYISSRYLILMDN